MGFAESLFVVAFANGRLRGLRESQGIFGTIQLTWR